MNHSNDSHDDQLPAFLRSNDHPNRKYDAATLWPVILTNIACGDSLTAALKKLDPSPGYWWAKDWLHRDPELNRRYQQAIEDRADRLAEELIELADTEMPEEIALAGGPAMSAWVQQLRVRVDVRKWAASKLKPKTYGDRLDLAVTSTQISITAALEEAQKRVIESKAIEIEEGEYQDMPPDNLLEQDGQSATLEK